MMFFQKLRSKKSFTLIELLLGLSIFAIIGSLIYSTYSAGIRVSRKAERDGDVFREVRWTYDLMERDLENAIFFDFSSSYEGRVSFSGSSNQFTCFIGSDQGIRVVTYALMMPDFGEVETTIVNETTQGNVDILESVTEEGNSQYLVRKEISLLEYLQDSEERVEDSVEIIATHIQQGGMALEYASRQEESQEIVWQGSWSNNALPPAVQIELTFVAPARSQKETDKTFRFSKKVLIPAGDWGADEEEES